METNLSLVPLLAGSVSVFTLFTYSRRGASATVFPRRHRNVCASSNLRFVGTNSLGKRSIAISDAFDSGNIKVLDASNPKDIQLAIREEPLTKGTDKRKHFQWFYFRVSNVKNVDCRFRLTNAAKASFPEAWDGYEVVHSYNPSENHPQWLRIPNTKYTKPAADDDNENNDTKMMKAVDPELIWEFTSERDTVWFAYFAPFSYERHQALIATAAKSALAETSVIGHTIGGKPMDLVKVGNGERKVWIIARQHPGESMAEWWMKGFITRLLAGEDKDSQKLREGATVYLVPNMNPDGSVMGHLRTNRNGANLNREWQSGVYEGYDAPTLERSPEVFSVLEEMKKTGVDLFIDVHGDEMIPDNFFVGGQGTPEWSQFLEDRYVLLNYAVLKSTDEFQVGRGYGDPDDKDFKCINSPPGEANLSVGSNHVGNRFKCVAATLEMPFKDTTKTAEKKKGWCPERAQEFGASMISAFSLMLPYLRGELGSAGEAMLKEAKEKTSASGKHWYTEGKKEE
mmetsp:Transcript_6433/g.10645  ORF Transcript_6433/g.10645 Transcript_6433/m.10645 type:complete len:512 (-) Transcript_6433:288-1823(-)